MSSEEGKGGITGGIDIMGGGEGGHYRWDIIEGGEGGGLRMGGGMCAGRVARAEGC